MLQFVRSDNLRYQLPERTTRGDTAPDQLNTVEKMFEKMKANAITRMEARSQPVSSIVGQVDRFLLRMELPNRKNGPKNLPDTVSFEETRMKHWYDTSSFT